MKPKIIICFLIFIPVLTIKGQWSGTNPIYPTILNSNVGIGTSTPPSKLSVYGVNPTLISVHNIAVAYNAQTNTVLGGIMGRTDTQAEPAGFGGLKIISDATIWYKGRVGIFTNNTDGTDPNYPPTEKFTVLGNGNIGIGTTTPTAKLHIENGENSDAAILATSSENNKLIVSSGSSQPTYCQTFKITQQFNDDRNNGYISFNRGASTAGGFLTFGTNGEERFRIDTNGNVGIGTTSPNQKLDVEGSIYTSGYLLSAIGLSLGVYGQHSEWRNFNYGSYIDIQNSQNAIRFRYGSSPVVMAEVNSDGIIVTGTGTSTFGGNVGIGTTTPGIYQLNVNGKIRANEVVVNTTGADFVFAPDYKLHTLSELESYIKENSHLPDIASATEMKENGMNMSEMQTKLLQKIEELTLYVIELKKENENLNKRLSKLEK